MSWDPQQPAGMQPEGWQPGNGGGPAPTPSTGLLVIPKVFSQHPSESRPYLFDWSKSIAEGQTISGVTYTVPAPAEQYGDVPDLGNAKSVIGIRAVPHGMMAVIVAVATRSDNAIITQVLVIRGFNG